jgi:hypothetical protein
MRQRVAVGKDAAPVLPRPWAPTRRIRNESDIESRTCSILQRRRNGTARCTYYDVNGLRVDRPRKVTYDLSEESGFCPNDALS